MVSSAALSAPTRPPSCNSLRRFALAGTGVRGHGFAQALLHDFSHAASLVALYDLNLTRMLAFSRLCGVDLPCHRDFARMVREERPDGLIICTPDATHDDLIALAFSHGLDVVVEKPLATTPARLGRILELERLHQRKVRVAFNCRYMPFFLEIKKLLMENPIGEIKSIQMEAAIDLNHGLEYFRRWHACHDQSGGLLVHKSTHHFDIMNWLVNDDPVDVMAMGSLEFFGRKGSIRGPFCRSCEHRSDCAYALHPDWEGIEPLYFDAEHEDGYLRDRCPFREEIDICDTMHVNVRYRRGAHLSYSLVAYSPGAGCRLSITGTDGKLETEHFFRGSLRPEGAQTIRIGVGTRDRFRVREIVVPPASGPHEGGDTRMFSDIFQGVGDDPWSQNADSWAGAMSCLIGIMGNASIRSGKSEPIPSREALLAAAAQKALDQNRTMI